MGRAGAVALGMMVLEMACDTIAQIGFSAYAISANGFKHNKVTIVHLCVVRTQFQLTFVIFCSDLVRLS
jgi:hypothetical protein